MVCFELLHSRAQLIILAAQLLQLEQGRRILHTRAPAIADIAAWGFVMDEHRVTKTPDRLDILAAVETFVCHVVIP